MFCHVKLSACFGPNVVVWCLLVFGLICPTAEVSDRRREERWSARGTSELPPSVQRKSGAAVRSTDFVRPVQSHTLNLLRLVFEFAPGCARQSRHLLQLPRKLISSPRDFIFGCGKALHP